MKTVLLTTTPVALGQKLNMPQHIHLLGHEICTALCMYVTWTFLHASDFKRAKQQKFSCHLHDRSGVTVNNSDISRNSRHLMHTHYKSHEVSSHSSTQLQRIFDYVKHETRARHSIVHELAFLCRSPENYALTDKESWAKSFGTIHSVKLLFWTSCIVSWD